MDETIVIPTFRLTPNELGMIRSKKNWPRLLVLSVMFACAVAAVLMFAGLDRIWALIALIVLFPVMFISTYFDRGEQFQKPEYGLYLMDRDIELSPQHVRQTLSNGVVAQAPWSAVTKFEDKGECLLICFAPTESFVIPRRVLETELEQKVLTFLFSKGLLKAS